MGFIVRWPAVSARKADGVKSTGRRGPPVLGTGRQQLSRDSIKTQPVK